MGVPPSACSSRWKRPPQGRARGDRVQQRLRRGGGTPSASRRRAAGVASAPGCASSGQLPGLRPPPSRLVATFASRSSSPDSPPADRDGEPERGMAGMIYEMARAAGSGLILVQHRQRGRRAGRPEILAEVVEDDGPRGPDATWRTSRRGALPRALARAHRRGVARLRAEVGAQRGGPRGGYSHTGALAGEDAVYDRRLRDWGAIRRADPASCWPCRRRFLPTARRAASGDPSNSGGLGVLSVDLCLDLGLVPAEFTPRRPRSAGCAADFAAAANRSIHHRADPHRPRHDSCALLPRLRAEPGVVPSCSRRPARAATNLAGWSATWPRWRPPARSSR